MQQDATDIESLKGERWPDPEMTRHGTFTIRSVGVKATEQGIARWIELESSVPPTEEFQQGRIIILKMLILEKVLGRGFDPLADVDEIYFWDRDWEWGHEPESGTEEKLTDNARVLYEIERLRQQFPFPAQEPDQVQKVTAKVTTPFGVFQAETLSYPTEFEGKLAGGKGGRWRWNGTYSLWLSHGSPFGVVAVETVTSGDEEYATVDGDGNYRLNGIGVRMKSKVRMELQAVGTNAKSAFLDSS
ncbi:MAG: hypothetical protein ACC628_18295 [Pirellulaceae bacterium]